MQVQSPDDRAGNSAKRERAPLTIEERVLEYLDRAEAIAPDSSPLMPSAALVVDGSQVFQSIVTVGSSSATVHAAFALSRHPRPHELQEFWRAQLNHRNPEVRFLALVELGNLADPSDLERILRVFLADPESHYVLSVHLRNWKDRRVVPALAEALYSDEPLVAEDAADSLTLQIIPGVPVLAGEETGPGIHRPEGYWESHRSYVQPYQRWWSEVGKFDFLAECDYWNELAGAPRPICMGRNK